MKLKPVMQTIGIAKTGAMIMRIVKILLMREIVPVTADGKHISASLSVVAENPVMNTIMKMIVII